MYALIASDWAGWLLYGQMSGLLVGRCGLPELLAIAHAQHAHIFLLWLKNEIGPHC